MITPTKEFWEVFKSTPGALSTAEALAIMNIAAQAPDGLFLELGTHKGKSALAASIGLNREYVFGKTPIELNRFYLVDPIFSDKEIYDELNRTLHWHKFNIQYFPTTNTSLEVIKPLLDVEQKKGYAYVFSDAGSHSDELPMWEVKELEDLIIPNGIICFHDVFSQFVKQTEAYEYLLYTGKYEPIEINWQEIFDYVAEHDLEEGNNSWHLYPELPHPPNFVGALKRK